MTNRPVTVGHRGWPERFPDNTLAGFLAASSVVDEVELDVRRSGDGKLVLAHDPVLGDLPIHETPWSVLAELDIGDGHHPALLDEAIAALPDTRIEYEIKNDPSEAGFEPDHRRALEAAERTRPDDIVTSFNPATLDAVRRVFPEVVTGYLVAGFGDMGHLADFCLERGHALLGPDQRMLQGPLPERDGLRYASWTVNSTERATQLAEWGVTSIITDNPGLISRHFEDSI